MSPPPPFPRLNHIADFHETLVMRVTPLEDTPVSNANNNMADEQTCEVVTTWRLLLQDSLMCCDVSSNNTEFALSTTFIERKISAP